MAALALSRRSPAGERIVLGRRRHPVRAPLRAAPVTAKSNRARPGRATSRRDRTSGPRPVDRYTSHGPGGRQRDHACRDRRKPGRSAGRAAGRLGLAPAENPHELVHDGDYIEGVVAPNAFQVFGNLEGELSTAVSSLSNAGTEVAKLAGYFNRLLESNDEQVERIVNKTEQTIDSLQRAHDQRRRRVGQQGCPR